METKLFYSSKHTTTTETKQRPDGLWEVTQTISQSRKQTAGSDWEKKDFTVTVYGEDFEETYMNLMEQLISALQSINFDLFDPNVDLVLPTTTDMSMAN